MAIQVLPPKHPDETITLEFDFSGRLLAVETLTGGGCTAIVGSGVDPSPSSIISGAATQSGFIVRQVVTGGLPGVVYVINCEVTTSESNVLINQARLAVVSENPYD